MMSSGNVRFVSPTKIAMPPFGLPKIFSSQSIFKNKKIPLRCLIFFPTVRQKNFDKKKLKRKAVQNIKASRFNHFKLDSWHRF